ncbi:MAG TPA: hypothetical protein V6C63_07725 [Allocoleopsis sp.]
MPTPIWTKEQKEFLIHNYNEGKNLNFLESKLPFTRQQITAKAAALKLGRSRDWSDREKFILNFFAESMPFEKVVRAYNHRAKIKGFRPRSKSAISAMLKKLSLSRSLQSGCYGLATLAEALGISESPVRRWIKEGLLKAERQSESDRSHYAIYQHDFVQFALAYPGEIAKLNLDESAILWLLSEIAAAQESELARAIRRKNHAA